MSGKCREGLRTITILYYPINYIQMANIRPIIRKGKTDNETTIYIRFTEGRNHDYTVVTKHKIKPSQWNNEKNEVRRIAEMKNL